MRTWATRQPGWCRNLIEAGRLQPDERVLVMFEEPFVVQGSQLAEAVKQPAGGRGLRVTQALRQ